MRLVAPALPVAICLLLTSCGSKSKDGSGAAAGADPNTAVVDDSGISLGGERLGNAPEDKIVKVDSLFQKLKERREEWKTAHPGDKFPGTLTLEIGPNVTCRAAMSVFQTAGFAGYPSLTLKQGATSLEVPCAIPRLPSLEEPAKTDGQDAFAALQSDGNVELKPSRCGGAYDVVPAASLPATVKEWCGERGDCLRQFRLRCDAGTPMSKVLPILESIRKISAKMELSPTSECKPGEGPMSDSRAALQLAGMLPTSSDPNLPPPAPAPTLPPGKKPPVGIVRSGAVTAVGGLTSEEVVEAMKPKLDAVKACWETGALQNPNLQGRVSVRMAIGKKGAIMTLTNGGSDLPDAQVVDCVLTTVSTVTFPAKGTIGSVNYPFMLSPK